MADKTCQECRVGRLRETKETYVTTFKGQVVTDTRVPGMRCDVCGAGGRDLEHLRWVEELVEGGR